MKFELRSYFLPHLHTTKNFYKGIGW